MSLLRYIHWHDVEKERKTVVGSRVWVREVPWCACVCSPSSSKAWLVLNKVVWVEHCLAMFPPEAAAGDSLRGYDDTPPLLQSLTILALLHSKHQARGSPLAEPLQQHRANTVVLLPCLSLSRLYIPFGSFPFLHPPEEGKTGIPLPFGEFPSGRRKEVFLRPHGIGGKERKEFLGRERFGTHHGCLRRI